MAAIDPHEAMTGAGRAFLSEVYRQWESGDTQAAYSAAVELAEAVAAGEVFDPDYLPGGVMGPAFLACPDFPPEE